MSMWLYQLNQEQWTPEIFRYEIWEDKRWTWNYGKKKGDNTPETGDTVIFFYAVHTGNDPGIYGWAIVDRCDDDNKILYFIPTTPTNLLKMDPWWDDEAKKVTDEIRGSMKRATLFQVHEAMIPKIRLGIKKWLNLRT